MASTVIGSIAIDLLRPLGEKNWAKLPTTLFRNMMGSLGA